MPIGELVATLLLGIPVLGYFGTAICLYLLAWAGQWLWAWIDDSEIDRHNLYVRMIMRMLGYKPLTTRYEHIKNDERKDFEDVFAMVCLIPMAVIWCVCLIVLLSIIQPLVPVILVLIVILLFIIRFIRRLSKVVTKHVNDPDAHNKKD